MYITENEPITLSGGRLMTFWLHMLDIIENKVNMFQDFFQYGPGSISAGIKRSMQVPLLARRQQSTDKLPLEQRLAARDCYPPTRPLVEKLIPLDFGHDLFYRHVFPNFAQGFSWTNRHTLKAKVASGPVNLSAFRRFKSNCSNRTSRNAFAEQ
jgi:hypothetical protein